MKWQLFIGSLFAVWLSSCAKQHIVLPQEDVLYRVESFFAYHPDSVLVILDTLQTEMLSAKERAHYCLLKFKVRDAIALYDITTFIIILLFDIILLKQYFFCLSC